MRKLIKNSNGIKIYRVTINARMGAFEYWCEINGCAFRSVSLASIEDQIALRTNR